MSKIKHYIATERFWETLEALRDTPDFDVIGRKIDEVLVRKSENAIFRSDRDKLFDADPRLKGIWHCKLTSESDAVLFYAIKGDAVVLSFVGSYEDYPFHGAKEAKVPALVQRMKRAIDARHVEFPAWTRLHRTVPDDLIHNRRLLELEIRELKAIHDRLVVERADAPIFEAVHGVPLIEAPSEQDFDAWMASIDKALVSVRAAARQVEIGRRLAPEKGIISNVAKRLVDAVPLTCSGICKLVREVAAAAYSAPRGHHVGGPLSELVETLETEPYRLDGSLMSYLLGEACWNWAGIPLTRSWLRRLQRYRTFSRTPRARHSLPMSRRWAGKHPG